MGYQADSRLQASRWVFREISGYQGEGYHGKGVLPGSWWATGELGV